ncbi:methionine aminopeptidase 1 [Oxobacter pfennigii]|uniref:Methionine aminopeptidase n=1 Tax=Oxobacter pfennigii TaxID=36849 RepID=A0A0P8Y7T1_9CLOT|nr:type I methionyl aminopeptidase [Oxobacter pfennigii]KPU42612.1 methionine aminopeptidase 1 [Oxobacter pfennigii]
MIVIKSDNDIIYMKQAGKVVAMTLEKVREVIKPGVTTAYIDNFAEQFILGQNAIPAFKGLYGFPATLCISINEEVVHGIPGDRILNEGDIVSIDCGAMINGFYSDAARTYPVGTVSKEARKLIDVTQESFFKGIENARIGKRLEDISHAIQVYVEKHGFSIVRDYVGHGIGRAMHEDPQVPNYGRPGRGVRLVKGMCLAIEPMVNMGGYQVKTLSDEWTVVTADGSLSAHYENTIVILDKGPEILTVI